MNIDMNLNTDFFENPKNELYTEITDNNPFTLYFGHKGLRYYIVNDVTIIPNKDSLVNITIDLENSETINLQISNQIKIYQRNINPYPSFLLCVGTIEKTKMHFFEGKIKISGNCLLIQKSFDIYDC